MKEPTRIIRISLATLNKLKHIFPPRRDESMTHYFERVARYIEEYEYTLEELNYNVKHRGEAE